MKFLRDRNRWNHQQSGGALEWSKDLVEQSKDFVIVQLSLKLLVAESRQTMWKRFVYELPAG